MTNLQSNGHIVRTESTVQMDQIQNLRLLHNADYMDKNINRNEHPHLIKKYSDQWKDLVKESLLTEECVSSSFGMNGIKQIKYYFQKLVKEENVHEMFPKNKNDDFENDAIMYNYLHGNASHITIVCIILWRGMFIYWW